MCGAPSLSCALLQKLRAKTQVAPGCAERAFLVPRVVGSTATLRKEKPRPRPPPTPPNLSASSRPLFCQRGHSRARLERMACRNVGTTQQYPAAARRDSLGMRPPKAARRRERLDAALRLEAALRLQRWFRRDLWLFMWDRFDTEVKQRMRRPGAVRIVEPGGQRYDFRATDLALVFITSGCPRHPITRRELLPPELKRLRERLLPRARVLFDHTLKNQENSTRAAQQEESLVSFLHAAAGACLDDATSAAESNSAAPFEGLLVEYEESVEQVVASKPTSLRQMFLQHRSLLQRRKHCCVASKFDALSGLVDHLTAMYAGIPPEPVRRPAFVHWLLEARR